MQLPPDIRDYIQVAEAQAKDIGAAHELISDTHYQKGRAPGMLVVAKLSGSGWWRIQQSARLKLDTMIIGAAVVGLGCTRGKPCGREFLAREHFPSMNLGELRRDVTIQQMQLAMINRVAVHDAFRGIGLGTDLAYECRRLAHVGARPARFIEVMTTRRYKEADALIQGKAAGNDFLQRAGFTLVPRWTDRKRRVLRPDSNRYEDTVRLYYWAPAV